ncbi:MAG: hypothetical protein P8Y40_08635, partial [Desulfobacterales bacterium]
FFLLLFLRLPWGEIQLVDGIRRTFRDAFPAELALVGMDVGKVVLHGNCDDALLPEKSHHLFPA